MSMKKVVFFLPLPGMLVFTAVLVVGSVGSYDHLFTGREEFDTLEEAYQFQKEIIDVAQSIGADVYKSSLSVLSPPTIEYRVYVQDHSTSFPYGERNMSTVGVYTLQAMLTVAFIAVISMFAMTFWRQGWEE